MADLNKTFVRELQGHLKSMGFYTGGVDGVAGAKTLAAFEALLATFSPKVVQETPDATQSIAWGAKVSKVFKERVLWISKELSLAGGDVYLGASYLMSVMAFETGESFRADIKNAAGSSGTGLIQFMSFTAKSMGTTVEALARLSPEAQLNYVYKYFLPYKGRLKTLADVYLAVLYPRAIVLGETDVVWVQGKDGLLYTQNKGLDGNKDGKVSKNEIVALVTAKYTKGLNPTYKG